MNINNDRQTAHDMIDHIFHDLLSAQCLTERPEQTALSHLMLDALLDGSIALCDAGTGIGKTYAYLVAGATFLHLRANGGQKFRPIIISTSSIALQNAVQTEYLPTLSAALMEDGVINQPLRAVVRKGKSHYVCDRRLERRLEQLDLSRKNWKAGRALLSLREQLGRGNYKILDVVFNWIVVFANILIYDQLSSAVVIGKTLRNQQRPLSKITEEAIAEIRNKIRSRAATIGPSDFFYNDCLKKFKRIRYMKGVKIHCFQSGIYNSPQQV